MWRREKACGTGCCCGEGTAGSVAAEAVSCAVDKIYIGGHATRCIVACHDVYVQRVGSLRGGREEEEGRWR